MGTGDRTTPYEGGRLTRRGLTGLLQKRRAAKHGELPDEDIVLGAETLMVDWAAANGITTGPAIEELDTPPGDLPVTRKTWTKPGAHPVTLYRIDGGGHGWPGGPQFLPARAIGPSTKDLDATALLLDMADRERAAGPAPLNPLGTGRAGPGVVVGEGEHDRVGVEGGGRGGAAVGADALRVVRAGRARLARSRAARTRRRRAGPGPAPSGRGSRRRCRPRRRAGRSNRSSARRGRRSCSRTGRTRAPGQPGRGRRTGWPARHRR